MMKAYSPESPDMNEGEKLSPEAEAIVDALVGGDEEKRKKLGITFLEGVLERKHDRETKEFLAAHEGKFWRPLSDPKTKKELLNLAAPDETMAVSSGGERDYGDEDREAVSGDREDNRVEDEKEGEGWKARAEGDLSVQGSEDFGEAYPEITDRVRIEMGDINRRFPIDPNEKRGKSHAEKIEDLKFVLSHSIFRRLLAEKDHDKKMMNFWEQEIKSAIKQIEREFDAWAHKQGSPPSEK